MTKKNAPVTVLVVGQTPPPIGGQAVMMERFLKGTYTRIRLVHVRLAFSSEMNEVGKFSMRKVWVLFKTIAAIYWARIRHRPKVLYYPPAGPNMVPVLRDIVLLCAVRWMFARTAFHFHAGGVSGFAPQLPAILRPLFRLAYMKPDLAMRLSPIAPEDGKLLKARFDEQVPNGIEDVPGAYVERPPQEGRKVNILFTAVLIPSKGVKVVLEAFAMLLKRDVPPVELRLMGSWGDAGFERQCMELIQREGMQDHVKFLGVRTGEVKDADFRSSDIFCFPSFFEAEVFPVVITEACMYGMPIITTRWRGLPLMVEHGVNGLLVEPHDPKAVADQLEVLVKDPAQRERLGREGRRIFGERYSLERHQRRMEEVLYNVAVS